MKDSDRRIDGRSGWERRLRDALADTSDAEPRPMSRMELPLNIDKLIESEFLTTLRRAAVLVPIVDRPDGATLVLTQRSEQLRSHKGQISFPGGRCDDGDADAVDTPIGRIPADGALNLDGVDVTEAQLAELFSIEPDRWLAETDLTAEYYAKFGDRVPQALHGQLAALRDRLASA